MIWQLVFIVNGIIIALHKSDYTVNQAKYMDKQLVQLYVDWNKMYIFSCKDEFNNPLIDHSTIQIRTPEAMRYVLENGISEEYSLHKIEIHSGNYRKHS